MGEWDGRIVRVKKYGCIGGGDGDYRPWETKVCSGSGFLDECLLNRKRDR
jgi:hypothetical protein